MYEGAPNFPDWGRFWRIIERHRVTILYTAPTAIRAFMRRGDEWPNKHDLSSACGCSARVGEPINPEAWIWYHKTIGGERCPIVDTWWQTETGAIMITTLPGATPSKPGSADAAVLRRRSPHVVNEGRARASPPNQGGMLVIKQALALACCATVWGDDERFRKQYFSDVAGLLLHRRRRAPRRGRLLLGRGPHRRRAQRRRPPHRHRRDRERAGRRIPPSPRPRRSAGRDDLKGQALVVFVTLEAGPRARDAALQRSSRSTWRKEIGKFARPDAIRFTDALPKTRSGKIMRRLLKDVAAGPRVDGRHLDARGPRRARQAPRDEE